nr:MAG TPA: hypothetical protein [Caudoviricetes sp.]DAV59786.1 MAG TPA: hypothetical protein [Caudoviricetes sp.]
MLSILYINPELRIVLATGTKKVRLLERELQKHL